VDVNHYFHFIHFMVSAYDESIQRSDRDLTRINLRLTEEEAQRFSRIVEIAEKKTLGYAPLSDIVKELIGLTPYRLLNDSVRKMLEKEWE
jgi:hypothetical protein